MANNNNNNNLLLFISVLKPSEIDKEAYEYCSVRSGDTHVMRYN